LEIKELLAKKRKARAKWQRSHASSDKMTYNRLSNNLKSKLRAMRTNSFENYVSTLNRYDNSIWKPIKTTRKPVSTNPPLPCVKTHRRKTVGRKATKEKSNTFAKHLADVFKPHEEESDDELSEYPQLRTQPAAPIEQITPKELKTAIRLLHTRNAPGMDRITPTMLKELPHKGILLLTCIFNVILRLHYWPLSLKVAEKILIPKPGKDSIEITSYRPISLLPTLAKLLEKLILCRIDLDHTAKDWIPSTPVWIPQSPPHHPAVSPHNSHNSQGPPQQ
jgi:hypothetical protein